MKKEICVCNITYQEGCRVKGHKELVEEITAMLDAEAYEQENKNS
jgi:hypothetical protein